MPKSVPKTGSSASATTEMPKSDHAPAPQPQRRHHRDDEQQDQRECPERRPAARRSGTDRARCAPPAAAKRRGRAASRSGTARRSPPATSGRPCATIREGSARPASPARRQRPCRSSRNCPFPLPASFRPGFSRYGCILSALYPIRRALCQRLLPCRRAPARPRRPRWRAADAPGWAKRAMFRASPKPAGATGSGGGALRAMARCVPPANRASLARRAFGMRHGPPPGTCKAGGCLGECSPCTARPCAEPPRPSTRPRSSRPGRPLPITADHIDGLAHRLVSGEERAVLARDAAGHVVGFGSIIPAARQLRALYVAPEHGRCGVGAMILARLEAMAAGLGLPELRMDASLNAEAFYRRHGFARQGRASMCSRPPGAWTACRCARRSRADLSRPAAPARPNARRSPDPRRRNARGNSPLASSSAA